MERAITASPRGCFAVAQALVARACRSGLDANRALEPRTRQGIQIATAVALTACGFTELWSGASGYSLVLLAGATVVGLTIRSERRSTAEPAPESARSDTRLQSEMILQLAAQRSHDGAIEVPTLSHEAWGDLMARVSHDLRTPLNAVIGFSDVMGSELFGPVGDQRYREYISHIRDSGRELLKSAEDTLAITSLLGASRTSPADPINLEALVAEASRAAGLGNVAVNIDDSVDVIGDQRALRQALVNLLTESALRAPDAGRTSVRATCEDEFVILEVAAEGARAQPHRDGSLRVCMARVLLELQGAQLIEIAGDGGWRAVTVLGRASQQEFFKPGSVMMGWPPRRPTLTPALAI